MAVKGGECTVKKIVKITLCLLLALVLLVAAAVGGLIAYSKNYTVTEPAMWNPNDTGLVQAAGRSLYDADGNRLQLRGINAGQILLQEGWMSPFALEPKKNADGSFVKDQDGNLQYPEFTEAEFRAGLQSNPNLKDYDLEELLDLYRSCIFTEEDFRIIKEDLKLNAIRLPVFYLDILNEDLSLKSQEDAFSYLDWFLTQAAKQELYVVLDLHGAPGSQNGREHSGTPGGTAGLWENEAYMDAVVRLWDYVSAYYTDTAPELGKWIATYDILNEPEDGGRTTERCWRLFDRIYDVIRENGDDHVITMEGCWDYTALPDPSAYGWDNVQYAYHWYNWWSNQLPYDLYFAYHDFTNLGRDYDVPVLIGEFTFFEDKAAWAEGLALFDSRNYSWTVWNYKTTVTGWWTSSWGVYTCQMNLDTAAEEQKCNVATCTYEEFKDACEGLRTENCVTSTLREVLEAYSGN